MQNNFSLKNWTILNYFCQKLAVHCNPIKSFHSLLNDPKYCHFRLRRDTNRDANGVCPPYGTVKFRDDVLYKH